MRIAFLCKRQYMGKDVIDDRYARLYEYPKQLALRGHDVMVFCTGYQGQDSGEWSHEAAPGRLRLRGYRIGPPYLADLAAWPFAVWRNLKTFSPDVVIGASDIPHAVMSAWFARRLRRPLVLDLYDNFEAFGQARAPGMVTGLRWAARSAGLVTTTSASLARYVTEKYRTAARVVPMPSTIDHTIFHPKDRATCREALGLPQDARLVGTAGGLHRDKGIADLYGAWDILKKDPRVHLVLAGPADGSIAMPQGERVHYLGLLPHARIPEVFAALDVATVCVLDTPFGRHCFPQKAYEIVATGTPVVASDVGAMHDLLIRHPQLRYPPGDVAAFASRIRQQLEDPSPATMAIEDWSTLIGRIEPQIAALARHSSH